MARDKQPWLRLYVDVLDNPKVQRLKGEQFKGWVNLLCLTKRNGGVLPGVDHIAFALRISEQKAKAFLASLMSVGLLDDTDEGPQPHDWDELQFESDSSTDRVRKHRERKAERPRNGEGNADETLHETPPDTETESDTDTDTESPPLVPPAGGKRGHRIDSDWKPDEQARAFATERGWSAEQIDEQAAQFLDHWLGKAGRAGVKLDWPATWRSWVRNAEGYGLVPAGKVPGQGKIDPDRRLKDIAWKVKRNAGALNVSRADMEACIRAGYLTAEDAGDFEIPDHLKRERAA